MVTVIGTDTNNCVDTAQTFITVNALPILSINGPAAICDGDSAQLIASGASTYQWLPAGFGNAITVFPNTNTTYTVIGTDANGCTDSVSQSLTVNPLPILNITPSSNSICAGGSVNLIAAANMPLSGFNWNTGATGNSIWVNPQTTSTYTVSGSNAYGCIDSANVSITAFALPSVQITPANSPICIGDTALLMASGAANYSWTPSSVLSATSGSTVNAFPTSSTMVTVIGTDTNNCVDTAQTFITVNALPILSINAPAAICDGDSAQLIASGASTYQWLPAGFGNAITVFPNTNTTYTVIGTDANGCTDSISQSLVVNPLPILSITPSSNTSCAGSSVNLAASSNMAINGFTWSTGASGNSIWVNPLTTTSYSVSGTNSYGCTDSGMVAITVFALPQVQLTSSNSSICIGDTTSLIASGAANYSWTPASFLSSATGSSVGAFPNTSMSFTVIGTDTNNCVDTATSFITVNSLPTLSINAPAAICNGGSAQLIASGANTYQWLPAGSGTTLMVSPNTTTNYTLIGTDTNGCVDSISQNLVVNPLPQIYINASKTSSCAGDSIQLFASANMNINSYNWSNGITGNSQWVNPMGTSSYSVIGLNSFGCADTALISISVNQYPIISLNTVDTNICLGDSVMLTTTNAVAGLSYQWSTGSTNTNINVSPATSSNYTVTAVDSIGCSDTSLVHVEVNALPIVNALANSTHQCANDTATIYVNTQSSASTYSWNNGLTASQFTTVLTSDTTFIVSVTDSLGCQNQDSVTVLVNPIPQLTLSPTSAKICFGDTIGLTVSSSVNPVNFLWYNNSTSSTIIVSPAATSLYSVTATDSLGCSATITDTIVVNNLPLIFVNPPKPEICQGNSISLTASSSVAGVTYVWNNGYAGSTLNVTPNNSAQYQVVGTDTNGCKSLVTAEVKVNPNPNVVINPNNIGICKGDSVLLNANTNSLGSLSYLWNTGDTTSQFYITPLANSSYNVAVTDSNGCTSTDTMNVMVTTVPSCNILAQSPICSADSSIITVAGSLATGAIVNWNFDGGTVVSGAGMGPLAVKWNSGGTYKVVLDISYKGCTSDPDTQLVEVLQTPTVDFSSMSTEACGSADIQFVNNTPGMQEYHWNFGDIHSNSDTSSVEHPQYHYSYPGTYFVALNVLSQDGCPAQLIKPGLINIHPNPIADFSMNKTKVSYASPMVNFYDRSIDAVSWEWNFDDPMSGQYNFSSDQDTYHEFQDTGIYDVMLIVTSDHNCKDTTMKRLINEDGPTLFIPNAFTPNGDGTNDTFFPKGTGYDWSTYEMYIYDRWGEMVFHTRNINDGWNGRKYNSQGTEIDDVYSYIITIKAPSGKGERFVGKVVLFH
jgi:gliding motility-associated-like protein